MHPEIAEVAEGSFRRKRPPEVVGSALLGPGYRSPRGWSDRESRSEGFVP